MSDRMSLFRTWTGQSQRSQKTQQPDQSHLELAEDSPTSTSQGGLQPSVSNLSTTDPFAGHLNHLTEHQESQLSKFKSTLVEQGLYQAGSPGQAASHDDQSLLRYLRARKFDIRGAVAQFGDTEIWSREHKIPELYECIDVDFYEKARKMYPQWTGHRDRRGIPVYVYVVKHLDTKNVNAYASDATAYKAQLPYHSSLSAPAKMLPLFALYENLLRFVLPLCTSIEGRPHPEVPVTNSNNIVDISGVGLRQFWNLKNHMQESSVLATAHYPETLDRIFIIGAPSFFPTVWGWVKRWFDPVTVNKIFVIPHNEVKARLSEYIDPDDFPKKYGGNLDWEFGMTPHMDDAVQQAVEKNGSEGWIEGPCLWEHSQRVPVGTRAGKPRRPANLVRMETPTPVQLNSLDTKSPTTNGTPTIDLTSKTTSSSRTAPTAVAGTAVVAAAAAAITTTPASKTQNGVHQAKSSTDKTKAGSDAPSIVVTNGDVVRPPSASSSSSSLSPSLSSSTPSRHEKPPMQRFVTAAEDLKGPMNPVPNGVS